MELQLYWMNAHYMVYYLIGLKKNKMSGDEKSNVFKPELLDSQPCENIFRQVRSLSSVYSTVINCSTKDILERIRKIQIQNDIMAMSSPNYI